jgi:hypothetical protein
VSLLFHCYTECRLTECRHAECHGAHPSLLCTEHEISYKRGQQDDLVLRRPRKSAAGEQDGAEAAVPGHVGVNITKLFSFITDTKAQ